MKSSVSIICFCVSLLLGFSLQAQYLHVQKTVNNDDVLACGSVQFTYTITIDRARTNVTLTDDVGAACFSSVQMLTPLSGGATFTPSGSSFVLSLGDFNPPMGNSITMVFIVSANTFNDGSIFDCDCCSAPVVSSLEEMVTGNEVCVNVKGTNNWSLSVFQPIVTGANCFRYRIRIRSANCSDYDLIGPLILTVTAPTGAVIVASGTNTHSFNANTSGNLNHYNSYYYYVDVEYPCTLTFTEPVSLSVEHTGTSTQSPTSCDLSYADLVDLGESLVSHNLVEPETIGEITKYNDNAHSNLSPGCDNEYVLRFLNSGTTSIENIEIIDAPIPSEIEILKICNPVSAYQLNSNPVWISGQPAPADYPNLTALKWNIAGPLDPTEALYRRICYRIKPATTVGTVIQNCYSATFDDNIACNADGCTQVVGQSFSQSDCFTFTVEDPAPKPNVRKYITSPNPFLPGETVDFCIVVHNQGSGDLVTTLTDNLPSVLTNLQVVGFESNTGVSSPYSCNGSSISPPSYSIAGNQLDVDINIPGICETRNTGSNCCVPLYNMLIIKFKADVIDCAPWGSYQNTAELGTGQEHTVNFQVVPTQTLEVNKLGKGEMDATFSSNGTTYAGGEIDYRITLTNTGNQAWIDPVFVDVLPFPGDQSLCNNIPRNSEYTVSFRNNSPITVSAPGSLTYSILGSNTSINCDSDCCGSGTPCPTPSWAAGANSATRSFKIQFSGSLLCGESIVIDLACRADASALVGQYSYNDLCANATNGNGNLANPSSPAPACIQIVTWEPPCCEQPDFTVSLTALNPVWNGTHTVLDADFFLQTGSIPTQEVRASIVDFHYDQEFADCFKCKNDATHLGTVNPATQNTLGSLVAGSTSSNREWIWTTGVPSLFDTGINTPLKINLPAPLNIPTCTGCVKICVKFEVMDVNCQRCERYVCFELRLPEPIVRPNPICRDVGDGL